MDRMPATSAQPADAIAHPLSDHETWLLIGAGTVLSVLSVLLVLRFTAVLDTPLPVKSRLVGLAVLLALVCASGLGLSAWAIHNARIHRTPVLVGLLVGLLGGLAYGAVAYPSDFHADLFGALWGYGAAQLLLVPLGVLAFGGGVTMWWFLPLPNGRVAAGLALVAPALQIGFHSGLCLMLLLTLEDLMRAARAANAPRESPAIAPWMLLVLLTYVISRRRR